MQLMIVFQQSWTVFRYLLRYIVQVLKMVWKSWALFSTSTNTHSELIRLHYMPLYLCLDMLSSSHYFNLTCIFNHPQFHISFPIMMWYIDEILASFSGFLMGAWVGSWGVVRGLNDEHFFNTVEERQQGSCGCNLQECGFWTNRFLHSKDMINHTKYKPLIISWEQTMAQWFRISLYQHSAAQSEWDGHHLKVIDKP